MTDQRREAMGSREEEAHAAPPPAPSRQGDGEEAGTAPRREQGESERKASGRGDARAEEEPLSEVHKINHGDKLGAAVPRRDGDR